MKKLWREDIGGWKTLVLLVMVVAFIYLVGCAATKSTTTTYDKDGKIVSVTENLSNYAVTKTDKKEMAIPKPGWWASMVNTFLKEFSDLAGGAVGTAISK